MTPNRLYATIPKTSDVEDGFRDITVAEIARGVDYMAGWIIDRFGRSSNFKTISYIGTADLRGAIVSLAALLLPSPRNPSTVNVSLMAQTESTKLLHAAEVAPIVQQLQSLQPQLSATTVPTFDDMLNTNPEHVVFAKTFEQAWNDPVVILHSSGSTGLPKPITMTHGSLAVLDNEHNLPEVPGRRNRDWSMWTFDGEARVYTVFPFFHLAGFVCLTLQTIFMNASPVLGPPNLVPDGALLKSVMLHQKLRAVFLPPAVVEELLQEPEGIELLKGLDFLACSGAPLNPETGGMLSKVVEIVSPYGSTEIYPQPELAPADGDWAWHEFHPAVKHEMRLFDESEKTFEFIVIIDEESRATTGAYHNMPGIAEYATKDLFIRHPDPAKPNLYKYYGRRDDIIVLANGEKFNPVPAEVSIASHGALKGAFLIGDSRTNALLLVEPREPLADKLARDKLIDEIWPVVEKSNSLIAGQGRIHRARILCATPDKPFTRTGKGTIVRKLTQETYKDEIEQIYAIAAKTTGVKASLQPTVRTTFESPAVVQFVRSILAGSFPPGENIGEHEDLFIHGLDSIQTLEIVTSLKQNLKNHTNQPLSWISPRTIFKHSNISELSQLIQAFLNDGIVPAQDSAASRVRTMNEAVKRYTTDLPVRFSDADAPFPKDNLTVALLGSTGYLGSQLLANLVRDQRISRIYCLNRSKDAQKRQETSLLKIVTDVAELKHKIKYITIDISRARIGLTDADFTTLAQTADIFIYNAWRLDFGISLRSFEPFLRTTRDLVDLSLDGLEQGARQTPARIVLVSSISSVGALASRVTAPEAIVEDPLATFNIGYGESKHVAERILNAASRTSGVPVDIVRVGQIGGFSSPTDTMSSTWADQAWISAIARTARKQGTIPTHVMDIDWVPVDTAAAILHDVALSASITGRANGDARFFHVIHRQPQPWDLLIRVLSKRLGVAEDKPLKAVSLPAWVRDLRAVLEVGKGTNDKDGVAAEFPAVKMVDYYSSLGNGAEGARWANDKVAGVSEVGYPVLDEELLGKWLESWKL
ncbi:uncharacterized protein B0I36DRAFT_381511 [Microdochium trichocladiopsis]|uniref:Carrier domain-containing protein n=1 Tax=Microdochium trichocladiopsis TaxID=1682393 RepID=A0A9P8Y801_9PEZI|nr:uncharacterized protein B0I36DRAFT_381511 [Microdochium trichocladiopsis]KAH7034609.1 hypothetical protein B0I36DRAFT_381511 [Microdochium trichocladiopsis]